MLFFVPHIEPQPTSCQFPIMNYIDITKGTMIATGQPADQNILSQRKRVIVRLGVKLTKNVLLNLFPALNYSPPSFYIRNIRLSRVPCGRRIVCWIWPSLAALYPKRPLFEKEFLHSSMAHNVQSCHLSWSLFSH